MQCIHHPRIHSSMQKPICRIVSKWFILIEGFLYSAGIRAIDAIPAAGVYGGYDAIDAYPAARRYVDYDSMDAIPAAGSYRSSDDSDIGQDTNTQLISGRRFRHENNWKSPVRRSRRIPRE